MNNSTQLSSQDIFGSYEIAFECLADAERTANFARALQQIAANSKNTLELGTGTGILAMLAVQSGSEHVDAIEINHGAANIARKNIRANNMQKQIDVLEEDAVNTDWRCSSGKQYDLIVAEMISTGLIEEQLIPAVNNLINSSISLSSGATSIPHRQQTFVELVTHDNEFHGLTIPSIQVEQTWQKDRVLHKISEPVCISDINLSEALQSRKPIKSRVSFSEKIPITKNGTVTAVRLSGVSILTDEVISGWTQCMNSPLLLPIDDEMHVKKGDQIKLNISYDMGEQMDTLSLDLLQL